MAGVRWRSHDLPDFDRRLRHYRKLCEIRPGLPTAETYEDALYVPASFVRPHEFTGALFDRTGRRIRAGDLVRDHERENHASPEPAQARVGGTGLYLGWLSPHFGHALLEGLARCWAVGEYDFAVYHAPSSDEVPAFLSHHLDRLGVPPVVLPTRVTRFERLVVPPPAFEFNTGAYQGFVDSFEVSPGTESRPVYVSRARLPRWRRPIVGEDLLEDALSSAGWRVVHPETMSQQEQAEVFSSPTSFAGPVGSAMHNLLFSRSRDVVYLTRTPPHDLLDL
jgi:Glycosyltransferase 61